jgi:hypothetical protein
MPTAKQLLIFYLCLIYLLGILEKRMAIQKKIPITLHPDYYAELQELATLQGLPLATMVRGMIDKQRPVVNALLKALTDIDQGKSQEEAMNEYMATVLELSAKEIRD